MEGPLDHQHEFFAMAVSELIDLLALVDEAKCFELLCRDRWPDPVRCSGCDSVAVTRNGHEGARRSAPPRAAALPVLRAEPCR